ncbi:MAG TPA: hypothetical protein VFV78_12460 [Vicinamibacterales bacterium]|nr:hypothetical protein [Vicinamibacterales bacterium]
MNRHWRLLAGLATVFLVGGCTTANCPVLHGFVTPIAYTHLDVRVYSGVSMSQTEGNEVAAKATTLLRTTQTYTSAPPDYPCEAGLTIDNWAPLELGGFDGRIDNAYDFSWVFGAAPNPTGGLMPTSVPPPTIADPRKVRVVLEVNWCGPETANALGCADISGRRIAVARPYDPDKEPVLWAHEAGHTHGLPDLGDLLQVMYGWIRPDNKLLTEPQCQSFRQ